jgi:hypothetical protein
MHPEILRQLTAQHRRDLQERAHQAITARTVSRALRALRHGTRTDEVVLPAIPDYVDGSFRVTGGEAASSKPQSQVPAAGRAA